MSHTVGVGWERLSDLVRYDVHEGEGETTVRLAGELDVSSPQLVALLEWLGTRGPPVVLDLRWVDFLDAGGLALLVLADRRLRDRGGTLVLRRPHRAVRRLLELSGSEVGIAIEEPAAWSAPAPDVRAICSEAVEGAVRITEATAGECQLVDSTGALRIVASQGCTRDFLDFFEVVDDRECPCGASLAREAPVYVPDVTRSPIFEGTPSLEVVRAAGIRSIASIPVPGPNGKPVGMVSVHSDRVGDWSAEKLQELRELAGATGWLLADQTS